MKCDKQCSYRTPYGYCSATKCQTNLGTTYAEPRHLEMDIKKYCIPKEEYNIPLVNEGIQEGRKLVFCKDCKYWTECSFLVPSTNFCGRLMKEYHHIAEGVEFEMNANDFCSRGERRDE